jgi:hypothetical protein
LGGRVKPVANPHNPGIYVASVGAVCPNCNGPIAFMMANILAGPLGELMQQLTKFLGEGNGPDVSSLKVVEFWPKSAQPSVPDHVPEQIGRAVLQAERNFHVDGNEEASAMMYPRSLELALKDKFPALTGTLAARIKQLVADKTLPQAMGDWADEIRDLGNDAAHDPIEVDRTQLTMIRGFADATLRYLYTLPAEINARRKLP